MNHMGASSTNAGHKSGLKVIVIVLMTLCVPGLWFSLDLVQAASPPITSSGLNTQVNLAPAPPPGKVQYDITGGTRPGGGTNLFHSFGDFNVPNNNIANFLNDSGLATSNILGRVTGGNISNIFGTIQTTGFGNANLFMMNPAGFLFGPNATINVGGMVAFTSADYLRLADGALFNAIPNLAADALLSTAPVAAFGFLGSNPGAIMVQGSQLSVADGTGISLIGGNITIDNGTLDNGSVQPARLSAPNGQINLATASSPGEFLLQSLQTGGFQQFVTPFGTVNQFIGGSLAGPNINGASFSSFGTLHLAPGSTVDTSQIGNSKVSIKGGQFVVDIQNASLSTADSAAPASVGQNNVVLNPGSSIFTMTSSADHGPDVQIIADNIQVLGTSLLLPIPPTITQIQTETAGSGPAGNISLTAIQNLELFTAFLSSTSSFAATGKAGNVDLSSTQGNISLTSSSLVSSQGNAGTLSLNAPHGDILLDSSIVFTSIDGAAPLGANGGGIQITANNLIMRNGLGFVPPSIEGDNFVPQVPGNITINLSGKLSLDGQATIQTIARGPALAASDLNITAHDVSITGGSVLNTQTQSSGAAGHLNIVTDSLELTNGGQIRSGSALGHDPDTGEPLIATGPGGTIHIQGSTGPATSVLIDGAGSAILSSTVGSGAGGSIFVNAHSVTLQNGGTLTADTFAAGNAGNVRVNADSVTITSGAQVTSSSSVRQTPFFEGEVIPSPTGNAGDVTIQGLASPAHSVVIDGPGSGIFTSTQGTGTGGNISVNANSVTLQNGAQVSSSSTGTGNAGNIHINSGNQFAMTNASVTTEADQSSGGAIKITTNPSGTVQLTNSTISASVLDGTGGGGSVNIDPQFVLLQNSQILANAVFGPGGNINITTNLLLPDSISLISASSQFGQQGTITIQSPIAPASGKIIPLPQNPLIATSLLSQRCAALASGNLSSFTVAGRDALPAEPSGWLSSPLVAVSEGSQLEPRAEGVARETGEGHTRSAEYSVLSAELGWKAGDEGNDGREAGGDENSLSGSSGLSGLSGSSDERHETNQTNEPKQTNQINETNQINQTDQTIVSLRRIAPPGFLTQGFAGDWSGCSS